MSSTTGTTTITASSHPPSSSGTSTTITTVTGGGTSILKPPGPPPITGDQFAKLMDAIQASQARMDTKLAEFQNQVCRSQDEAAAKAVKKSRSAAEAPYQYKKGNEAQAKFNAEVEDAVQEAMDELEGESRPSQSVERAKAALILQNTTTFLQTQASNLSPLVGWNKLQGKTPIVIFEGILVTLKFWWQA